MWIIYLKELLELVRDRRTLIFTVLIPIFVIPVLFGGFSYGAALISENALHAELGYAIFGKEHAPSLSRRFARTKGFREVALDSVERIKEAIGDERIKFALIIPPDYEDALAATKQGAIALHYNSAVIGDVVGKRVHAVIDAENSALREHALSTLNMSKEQLGFALNPIKLEEHSTAGNRERMGALAGSFLPYVLLIVCLTATMFPAIDIGAGEKERGTLETLLLAPVPRGAVVIAKFLVLFTVGLTSALLMVLSIGLFLSLFGQSIDAGLGEMMRSISVADLAMLAMMLVPTAAIFASLLLSISIYAKNFREAQGVFQPLAMLVLLPIMLVMLPGIELNWIWAMVPLTNVSLAMRELVKGTLDYRMFLVIVLSTALIAGSLLDLCRWWFNREEVLFRN